MYIVYIYFLNNDDLLEIEMIFLLKNVVFISTFISLIVGFMLEFIGLGKLCFCSDAFVFTVHLFYFRIPECSCCAQINFRLPNVHWCVAVPLRLETSKGSME